jgi:hypothetical protein
MPDSCQSLMTSPTARATLFGVAIRGRCHLRLPLMMAFAFAAIGKHVDGRRVVHRTT